MLALDYHQGRDKGDVSVRNLRAIGALALALPLLPTGAIITASSAGAQPPTTTPQSTVHAQSAFSPVTTGYWIVESDGNVFSQGNAVNYGPGQALSLAGPLVGAARTADGRGYWEVIGNGGILPLGDANFYGSEGNHHLNAPIVGIAATPDGKGYWEVASDGGVFTFGDAAFYGSEGNHHLNAPITAIAASPSGHGYWLQGGDGGIFTFGDADYDGSLGGANYPATAVAVLAQTPPVGTVAAGSPFVGTRFAHGESLAVSPDGRFAISYRTYNFCGPEQQPGACDYVPPGSNIIEAGGSVGGQITSVSGDTATTVIQYDPEKAFAGHSTTMTYEPSNDAVTVGPFTFCGTASPANFCGA
jgi:hypothetical protein